MIRKITLMALLALSLSLAACASTGTGGGDESGSPSGDPGDRNPGERQSTTMEGKDHPVFDEHPGQGLDTAPGQQKKKDKDKDKDKDKSKPNKPKL